MDQNNTKQFSRSTHSEHRDIKYYFHKIGICLIDLISLFKPKVLDAFHVVIQRNLFPTMVRIRVFVQRGVPEQLLHITRSKTNALTNCTSSTNVQQAHNSNRYQSPIHSFQNQMVLGFNKSEFPKPLSK